MARGYKIADGYIEVTAETDKGDREIRRFLRDTRGRLHDEQGRYAKEGELAGLAYGEKLTKAADKESEQGFRGMFSRWGKRMLGGARTLGGLFANKFVAIAIGGLGALPTAISAVMSAIGSAINIAGAGAALAPAAIGGLVLSMLALKTAFSGLGAALKAGLSGDMAAFAAATKDMAPAMQQAVKALVQLNPQIKELKKGVQQNFWGRFAADIAPLATRYLPMVGNAMASIAAGFGLAAHGVAIFLMQSGTANAMFTAFDNIAESVRNITSGLAPLATAFFTLFQVGASFLPGITKNFAGIADSLARMVANAAATGKLQAFIQSGLDKVKALGAALNDIVGIFRSIGAAASGVAGGGLFGAIGQLLNMVNEFFHTLQGQEVLSNFFGRLQAIGQLIIGLVGGALPGLLKFSDGLLTALQSLAPIAPVVGKALGDALAALAPLLPVIGKLLGVLLTLASGILSTIAAELGPLIALWAQLAGGLADRLLPVLQQLISQGLPVAIELGKAMADAFAPMIPIILQVADAFMGGLMQALPDLLGISRQLLPIIQQLSAQIGQAMLDALTRLLPYVPDLVDAMVMLIKVFAILMGEWLPKAVITIGFLVVALITVSGWFARLIVGMKDVVGWFAGLGASMRDFVSSAGSAVIGWVSSVVGWFAALPGRIWGALSSLISLIPGIFSGALDRAAYAVGYALGFILKMIIDLPGKIWAALTVLPGVLWGLFTNGWNMAKNATSAAISWIGSFAASLPGRVWGAIKSLGSIISSVAVSAWNAGKSAFTSGISAVVGFAKSLPGRIKSAIGSLGSLLYGVGQDIVRGLGDGISSMFGWVKNKAKEIASGILKGAKDALGIGSPSKVMAREVGRWIPPGIMQGTDREMPKLDRYMAGRVAALAQRPAQINVAAPNVDVPPTTVYVMLDGRQIGAQITLDPRRVARANVEGARQRGFLNTGRPAGALG
jgi:phage-related protein